MTVLVEESSKTFEGSGNNGPFTWTWRFLSNSHISVTLIDALGNEMPLTEGVDYALAGALSYAGGSLILTDDLAVGNSLYVERNTPALQSVDLRNHGDFFPETYEEALDALAMVDQELSRRVGAIESVGYTIDLNVTPIVASAVISADTSIGNVEVLLPVSGQVIVVKDGADANVVTFTAGVGQTVNGGNPLELTVDRESAFLVLLGTDWVKIG